MAASPLNALRLGVDLDDMRLGGWGALWRARLAGSAPRHLADKILIDGSVAGAVEPS
jgi:hypothetical protein